jgi:hypothetical protein
MPKISSNFNLIAKWAKVLNIHFPREDTHIANTYFKDAQCHPSWGKLKSNPQWTISSYPPEQPLSKEQKMASVGDDVEKREPVWNVYGNVQWCGYNRKQCWGS